MSNFHANHNLFFEIKYNQLKNLYKNNFSFIFIVFQRIL